MLKKTMALMALMTLTACDYVQRADPSDEQNDRLYRAAMDDYRAGRLDAAMKGFEKAVAKNPANASARFQLACLLQDVRRDFADAYCAYREYLLLTPASDKAKLAKERLVTCEKEMAKELAERYGLAKSGVLQEDVDALRKQLKESAEKAGRAEKALSDLRKRLEDLEHEKARLLAVVNGIGADGSAAMKGPSLKEARELLEEDDDEESPAPSREELELVAKEDSDAVAPEREETKEADAAPKAEPQAAKTAAPERPSEYEVQEGDTLYAISKRFYGDLSAWKKIRDANKALISTDGRLRAGDVIKLP